MNRLLLSALTATTLMASGAALAQGAQRPASPPPSPGHGFFEEMDTNKDGVVTRAEVNAVLEKRFAELDTDKNGVISAAERKAVFDRKREERFNERFAAIDTDKNGQISREELRAAHDKRGERKGPEGEAGAPPPPPGGPDHGPGRGFADRGFEGRHGGHGGGFGPGGFGPGGFGKGPEGDVTKAQFMAGPLRLFDVLDSNDDGKITTAERDAANAWHRGGPGRGPAPVPAPASK